MKSTPALLISSAAVATAAIVGASNGPQRPRTALWYALLRKPDFTPPGPLIGVTWTLLEMLLGGVGYRLLKAKATHARTAALAGWFFTLAGLMGFPWLQFRQRRLASSSLTSAAMLVSASCTVVAGQRVDKFASAMAVPLLAWLSFATLLSEELWRRNPALSRD